jgi:hypothetical protein
MAPATKPAAGKGGPQRSIKSFFASSSPAKAVVEASPGGKQKKKEPLVIGPVETPKKDAIDVESGDAEKSLVHATPGKRKVGHVESSPTVPSAKKQKLVIGEEKCGGVSEDEVTPVKRRRLRKVKEDGDAGGLGAPEAVIGRRLKVYWPLDKAWYAGKVTAYNASEGTHAVVYDDGEEQDVDVAKEKVEWLSESEETENRPKRRRRQNSDLPAAKATVVEEDKGARRGRARRQIKCVVESDDSDADDEESVFECSQEAERTGVEEGEQAKCRSWGFERLFVGEGSLREDHHQF